MEAFRKVVLSIRRGAAPSLGHMSMQLDSLLKCRRMPPWTNSPIRRGLTLKTLLGFLIFLVQSHWEESYGFRAILF